MVFDWFDPVKNGKGADLFRNYIAEIKKLEDIEHKLNAESKKISSSISLADIETIRTDIVAKLHAIEMLVRDFKLKFDSSLEKLEKYIKTSSTQINYIPKIEHLIKSISEILKEIYSLKKRESFDDFLSDSFRLRERLEVLLDDLEVTVADFKAQSKYSLEFLCKKGSRFVSMDDFLSAVRRLGGRINNSHGKGDHFYVEFALFNHVVSPSHKEKTKVSYGVVKSMVDDNLDRISSVVDPRYLKYYFFSRDHSFRNLFVEKFKKFFEL